MRFPRSLLALAAVPLLAAPAAGDAPPCLAVRDLVDVCGTPVTTGVAQLGQISSDATRDALCGVLAAKHPEVWQAVCKGTYDANEICVKLMNDYGLAPFDDEIASICYGLVRTICEIADVCAAPSPASISVPSRPGHLVGIDPPIG